jgi:hypothetical protein
VSTKTKTKIPTDAIINRCLARIGLGFVDAAYALRDYLEETGHELADELRLEVACHRHMVKMYLGGWRPRIGRCWNTPREIGVQHLFLIKHIAQMFRRRWRIARDRHYDRYAQRWRYREMDVSYARNLAWLDGLRATVAAAAS